MQDPSGTRCKQTGYLMKQTMQVVNLLQCATLVICNSAGQNPVSEKHGSLLMYQPPVWLPNGSSLLSMLHESWVGTNWPIHRGKTFFQQRERERSHCTTFLATGKGFNLKFRIEPIEPSKSAEAQLLFLTPAKALFCICFASRFVIDTFCGWEKGAGVYQNGWCLPQAHAASFQLRLKEDANHSGCMQ